MSNETECPKPLPREDYGPPAPRGIDQRLWNILHAVAGMESDWATINVYDGAEKDAQTLIEEMSRDR